MKTKKIIKKLLKEADAGLIDFDRILHLISKFKKPEGTVNVGEFKMVPIGKVIGSTDLSDNSVKIQLTNSIDDFGLGKDPFTMSLDEACNIIIKSSTK